MEILLDGATTLGVKRFNFAGGEVQVRLGGDNDLLGSWRRHVLTANIRTNIKSSDDLMALLLATDALRRACPMVEISATIKYLPYARQDRVCYPGEALSLKVMCDLINAQRYSQVEVWDAHSDVALALLDRVHHVPAYRLINKIDGLQTDRIVAIAPDRGAVKRATEVAESMRWMMLRADKVRDTDKGHLSQAVLLDNTFKDDPTDRDFLIVDDICDGGRTFINLARVLRPRTTGKVMLYVTHGIFSAGYHGLAKVIDRIYVANPFPDPIDFPDFIVTN